MDEKRKLLEEKILAFNDLLLSEFDLEGMSVVVLHKTDELSCAVVSISKAVPDDERGRIVACLGDAMTETVDDLLTDDGWDDETGDMRH